MKNILLILLLLIAVSDLYAQDNQIIYSKPFDEPSRNWDEILILKNGNTAYLSIDGNGVDVTIYNSDRKQIVQTHSDPTWTDTKFTASTFEGMFEVNGKVVVMIRQSLGERTPTLYRLVVDPVDGKVNGEALFSLKDKGDFSVYKDPKSDVYAVVLLSPYDKDNDKERVRVALFDSNNRQIKKIALNTPDNTAKVFTIQGACLYDKVFYMVYGAADNDKKKSKVYITKLDNGSDKFDYQEISIDVTAAQLNYNPVTERLQLLVQYLVESHQSGNTLYRSYGVSMNYINPGTLRREESKLIEEKKLKDYARRRFKQDSYFALPVDMFFNADGTTTILMEQNNIYNLGFLTLSSSGDEQSACIVHTVTGRNSYYPGDFYRGSRYSLYKSFGFKNTVYTLINDVPEHFSVRDDEIVKTTVKVDRTNTILYKLQDSSFSKSYFFGDPKDEDTNRYGELKASCFDAGRKTFAVLIISRSGRERKAHIAWVKID